MILDFCLVVVKPKINERELIWESRVWNIPEAPHPPSCPFNLTHSWKSFLFFNHYWHYEFSQDWSFNINQFHFLLPKKIFSDFNPHKGYKWFPGSVDLEQMYVPNAYSTIL